MASAIVQLATGKVLDIEDFAEWVYDTLEILPESESLDDLVVIADSIVDNYDAVVSIIVGDDYVEDYRAGWDSESAESFEAHVESLEV